MANYGLPYMGSKDKVIHKIAAILPAAENFYDLFGGGFSVTHYMLLHRAKRYKHFHFNELQASTVQLIKDAIAGKYNYKVFKPKWIDRETFERDKARCAYTRIVWSFGNDQKSYIFGKDIEAYKRSLHQAVVFGEFNDMARSILKISKWPAHLSIRGRRLACRQMVVKKNGGQHGDRQLQQLERLERLEQLERLQRLQRLERLERLELTSASYDQIPLLPNSIIYCDPPYKGTASYLNKFDHDKFWEWVRNQSQPVFVSEYTAPPDIKTVMAIRHKKLTNSQTTTDSVEKLFGNEAAIAAIKR
jgi:site-specific DNA-adenine methylase